MKNRSIRARHFAPVLSVLSLALFPSVQAQTVEVNPMVISASRIPQALSDVLSSVSVISREDIEKSQAPTLADLLQGEAGFEFGRNGGPGSQTSYFLRGQNSTNVVVLVDGVRTQTDSGGNLTVTDIPLALIERIEVLRGNAGALYGEAAVGGVINIYTRQFKGDPVPFGAITLGSRKTLDSHAGFAGTLSDYNFNFVLGKTSTDGFSALNSSVNTAVNPDKDGNSSVYASVKVDKKIAADLSVGLRIRGTQSKTDYDSGYGSYGDLPADLHKSKKNVDSAGAYIRKVVTEQWVTILDVSVSNTTYSESKNGLDSGQYSSIQNAVHWSNQYQTSEQSTATFGLDLVDNQHEQKNSFQLTRKTTGAYAGLTQRFDQLTAQVNLRHDQIDIERTQSAVASNLKPNATTGLLGLGYQLTPVWRLTATASTGFKAPSAYDISTNAMVNSEKYQSREAGLVYGTGQTVGRLVYFVTHTDNAIGYNSSDEAVNIGRTQNKGIELNLRTLWLRNNVKFTYVDQNPWNVTDSSPLDRRASHYGAFDISRRVAAYDVGTKIFAASARPEFGSQLAGYALLSVYASRKVSDTWIARVRLENLTNKRYELAGGYNTPGRGLFATLQYSPK